MADVCWRSIIGWSKRPKPLGLGNFCALAQEGEMNYGTWKTSVAFGRELVENLILHERTMSCVLRDIVFSYVSHSMDNDQEVKTMDIQTKIEKNKQNIWKAIEDYRAQTYQTYVLDDVSERFVDRLARDNAYAKRELRNLFRKSPVWDEELDALVVNGTRTHNPDTRRIQTLADEILYDARWNTCCNRGNQIDNAIAFFTNPGNAPEASIAALESLAPNAYAPGKKPSRIFRALCDALGVSDDSAGSRFQRLYAQFADELSAKKIDFKLYVSLNPAHFITMSNPKNDKRGDTLTSCHSFNSTEYSYNNGCSGYARDEYTFITFVAADPSNPETLNNRKTMRQIFAYKPGNGLLLQSRLYNTFGGTYGAQADSKLYRDLVQREISDLEDAPNLWQTYTYFNNNRCTIGIGTGFGGYADWVYSNFDAKISIRKDHTEDYESFYVGNYGLCIECGCEIDERLYCTDCKEPDDEAEDESERCEECDEYFHNTYPVHDCNGNEIYVCVGCSDRYYFYCDECGSYHPKEGMTIVNGDIHVCSYCLESKYKTCSVCGEYFLKEDLEDGLCPTCRATVEEEEGAVA